MAEAKKSRKHGRNKNTCAAYFSSGRYGVNKAKKLYRHLSRHPDDAVAAAALNSGDLAAYRQRARSELRAAGAKWLPVMAAAA